MGTPTDPLDADDDYPAIPETGKPPSIYGPRAPEDPDFYRFVVESMGGQENIPRHPAYKPRQMSGNPGLSEELRRMRGRGHGEEDCYFFVYDLETGKVGDRSSGNPFVRNQLRYSSDGNGVVEIGKWDCRPIEPAYWNTFVAGIREGKFDPATRDLIVYLLDRRFEREPYRSNLLEGIRSGIIPEFKLQTP